MDVLDDNVNEEEPSETSNTPPPGLSDPWTQRTNDYLMRLRQCAEEKHRLHDLTGYHFRQLDVRWGVPAIIIPAACSPLVVLMGYISPESCHSIPASDYIASIGFLLSTIVNGIYGFFKFGQRSTQHYMYSAKYSDIITDIDTELIKKKQFRINADLFVATIKMKYDNLIFGEPIIPLNTREMMKKYKVSDFTFETLNIR